jgi:hypothetical protein
MSDTYFASDEKRESTDELCDKWILIRNSDWTFSPNDGISYIALSNPSVISEIDSNKSSIEKNIS